MRLNKIYNEDCLEGLKKMPDKSVDLVVTDPPYILGKGDFGFKDGHNRSFIREIANITDGFDLAILEECVRVLKKINFYVFCSTKQLKTLLEFAERHKLNYNVLTWHKSNPTPTYHNQYMTDTEFVVFMRERGVKKYGTYESSRTYRVTTTNRADKKLYKHPTIKPTHIIEDLITNSSKEGDVILDPFMGSGTTAVACQNLGRKYIGFELDKGYYRIARKRLIENKRRLRVVRGSQSEHNI